MSRPLHAVLTELLNDEAAQQAYAADPDGFLEGAGHAGLPGELAAEAIVSFADTAPPAVAEHLAPFVKAHGPVPDKSGEAPDPAALDGLALLADAPTGGADAGRDAATEPLDPAAAPQPEASPEPAAVDDLGFGSGAGVEPTPDPAGDFGNALTEIPAADDTGVAPAHVADEPLLAPDPALQADDTEPEDDAGTE